MAKTPKKHPLPAAPKPPESAPQAAAPQYQQFTPGQRVKDIYGSEHVVDRQNECCVYVRGMSGWYHPSKLHPID